MGLTEHEARIERVLRGEEELSQQENTLAAAFIFRLSVAISTTLRMGNIVMSDPTKNTCAELMQAAAVAAVVCGQDMHDPELNVDCACSILGKLHPRPRAPEGPSN